MKYFPLGRTGMRVSQISFGASSLGGVFRSVREQDAIQAVHTALDLGVNYIDVAPAYGGTKAESVLGKALKGINRSDFYVSTKVGKYTAIDGYGKDTFDYSADGIRRSLDQSSERIGVDYFDVVYLHDIEYLDRRHTEWALLEGLQTLHDLRAEGRIGAVGIGMYPPDLWQRVLEKCSIDVGLSHNLYTLQNNRLLDLLPLAKARGIGMINASPFASGLLTSRGAPVWHPATPVQRAVFEKAAAFCRACGSCIEKLALQFSSQHPEIVTTMFSSADPASVKKNIAWSEEPMDVELLLRVHQILEPVANQNWKYS
jgi:L-galactose dehydrogenase